MPGLRRDLTMLISNISLYLLISSLLAHAGRSERAQLVRLDPLKNSQRYTIGIWFTSECQPSARLPPLQFSRSSANPYIFELETGQPSYRRVLKDDEQVTETIEIVEQSTSGALVRATVELGGFDSSPELLAWSRCCRTIFTMDIYINAMHEEVENLTSSLKMFCQPHKLAGHNPACRLAGVGNPEPETSCQLKPHIGYTMPADHDVKDWSYKLSVNALCPISKSATIPPAHVIATGIDQSPLYLAFGMEGSDDKSYPWEIDVSYPPSLKPDGRQTEATSTSATIRIREVPLSIALQSEHLSLVGCCDATLDITATIVALSGHVTIEHGELEMWCYWERPGCPVKAIDMFKPFVSCRGDFELTPGEPSTE